MRALPPKVLRELRDLVASLPEDVPNVSARRCDALVSAIDSALKPKRAAAPARKRRTQKAQTRREKVADLRALVLKRADGYCENTTTGAHRFSGYLYGDPQMDHFHGGANRRPLESLEGCWMLCGKCHQEKGASRPSRKFWLIAFLCHSLNHGYNTEPQRKAQAELDALELQARDTP